MSEAAVEAGVEVEAGAQLADAWVRAIAAGDEAALLAVLDPSVSFGALTPGAAWEAATAVDVAAIVLGRWFAAPRRIESVEQVDQATVGDRRRVGYRFLASGADGGSVIEQQAYFEFLGDRITWLRILCSGFRSHGG